MASYQEKVAELHAVNVELAREQDIKRMWELKRTIAMNGKALAHLRGIPARHAQKRIADARDELGTLEMLARLYEEADSSAL